MSSWLEEEVFRKIISHTPLISIDLVVKNKDGCVLLGERLNRPAKDYWFVPGGRVLKNEHLQHAFSRLTKYELGVEAFLEDATLIGVYEHFYDDSIFGEEPSTHYIVIGLELALDLDIALLPGAQHGRYLWFTRRDLLSSESVHDNTKAYFLPSQGLCNK